MIEIYQEPKKAKLKIDFEIGEIHEGEVDESKIFDIGTEVLVIGLAYQIKRGNMMLIYSKEVKEATTILELFLEYEDAEESV